MEETIFNGKIPTLNISFDFICYSGLKGEVHNEVHPISSHSRNNGLINMNKHG